ALPTEDRHMQTRSELRDELSMLLGGRTAEELVFGDPTTGAQNDIERATQIARAMVTEFGMTDALGPQQLGQRHNEPFIGRAMGSQRDYSDEVSAQVDAEVRKLIDTAHDDARQILLASGENPDRDGLLNTPARVARMYAEVCGGLFEDPDQHLMTTFEAGHDEMVMVRDIPLYSLCEHHLVPFVGKAHVAYIPGEDGRITGLSKLARLVDTLSKRPQVQERLTTQVADEIDQSLQPRGVLVVIEAEHLCMSMRGVRKPGSITVTSAVRGQLRDSVATRNEALQFIHS